MAKSAWLWAVPLAALTLAVAAGGAALALLTADGRPAAVDIARFTPADAELYVTLNLASDHPQAALRDAFLERWSREDDDSGSPLDSLLGSLGGELGVSYTDDIAPWFDGEVVVVGLEGLAESPRGVVIAPVDDPHAAADFLDYVAALGDAEPDSYLDARLLVFEDGPAVGLSDEFMLLANSRSTLVGALRDIDFPPSSPLAMDETFRQAQAAVPDDGFMFAFWRANESISTIDGALGGLGSLGLPAEASSAEYVAAAAAFIDGGLRVDVAAPASGAPARESASGARSLDLFPADTVALISVADLAGAWDELSSELGPAAEDLFTQVESVAGLDIERDVLGALTGETALALLPSDIQASSEGLPGVDLLLLAELSADSPLESALAGLAPLLQAFGAPLTQEVVGDRETTFFRLGEIDPGLEEYELGYFLSDGAIVIGSTRSSIEALGGESLRDSAKFSRVAGYLPEEATGLVYVDFEGALGMASGLTGTALGDSVSFQDDELPPLGALLAASHIDESGMSRALLVLTLQE